MQCGSQRIQMMKAQRFTPSTVIRCMEMSMYHSTAYQTLIYLTVVSVFFFLGTTILTHFFNPCVLFLHSEVAFGYKGLQIQLYYSAGNLSTLFKVKYTARVTEKFDCVEVQLVHFMSYTSISLTVLTCTVFMCIQSSEKYTFASHSEQNLHRWRAAFSVVTERNAVRESH